MTPTLHDRKAVLSDFFQSVADAFLSGDHEWLSGIYIHPLVIYSDGEITLERTPEETLDALFERREVVCRAGTKAIRSTVFDIGPDNAGRYPVRVDWEFLNANGKTIARNKLRYFCRFDQHGHARIEILEFLERGFASSKSIVTDRKH